tara:strand:+ start:1901 stop:2407 length:507 start_codon:yes stop_codon:yes gene_type:complete
MFIAIKDTKVITIHGVEWQCRRNAKGLDKSDYWTWLESVTTEGVPDYSGEDYEIVETEINIQGFYQSGHITETIDGISYHLKWDASKKEVVKDDTAKTAHNLAEEWKQIRTERNRLLAETDWVVIKARENGGTVPAKWKTYRVALRDIPSEQSSKTKYSEITWPTRPE